MQSHTKASLLEELNQITAPIDLNKSNVIEKTFLEFAGITEELSVCQF